MCFNLMSDNVKEETKHIETFVKNVRQWRNKIRVWKIFTQSGSLSVPMLKSPVYSYLFPKYGTYVSDRNRSTPTKLLDFELSWRQINSGFHCFTNQEVAKKFCDRCENEVIMPVWVYKDDVVAVNTQTSQIVCHRITLQKRDFNRATRR